MTCWMRFRSELFGLSLAVFWVSPKIVETIFLCPPPAPHLSVWVNTDTYTFVIHNAVRTKREETQRKATSSFIHCMEKCRWREKTVEMIARKPYNWVMDVCNIYRLFDFACHTTLTFFRSLISLSKLTHRQRLLLIQFWKTNFHNS